MKEQVTFEPDTIVQNWRVTEKTGVSSNCFTHMKFLAYEIVCISCGHTWMKPAVHLKEVQTGRRKMIKCPGCTAIDVKNRHMAAAEEVKPGDKYDKWVILKRADKANSKMPSWMARHSCGYRRIMSGNLWLEAVRSKTHLECGQCIGKIKPRPKPVTKERPRNPSLTPKQDETLSKVLATRDRDFFEEREWATVVRETRFDIMRMSDEQCDAFLADMVPATFEIEPERRQWKQYTGIQVSFNKRKNR